MSNTTNHPRKSGARSGGPKTAKGKSTSSLNAVKHGATSPRLLNSLEVANYTCFFTELSNYYKSSNPLVRLQIERISRLKVLVERVQEQMDSLHRITTTKNNAFDLAVKAMDLDDAQTRLAAQILQWKSKSSTPEKEQFPFDRVQLRLFSELNDFADGYINTLQSHGDFLKFLPHFCDYIVSQADDRKQPLLEYLRSLRPQEPVTSAPAAKASSVAIHTYAEINVHTNHSEWKEAHITDVSVAVLKTAMGWVHDEALTYLQDFESATPINRVIKEVDGLALPDSTEIDRLMRYQTTLQRQLSSAMGELLALIDRERSGG